MADQMTAEREAADRIMRDDAPASELSDALDRAFQALDAERLESARLREELGRYREMYRETNELLAAYMASPR